MGAELEPDTVRTFGRLLLPSGGVDWALLAANHARPYLNMECSLHTVWTELFMFTHGVPPVIATDSPVRYMTRRWPVRLTRTCPEEVSIPPVPLGTEIAPGARETCGAVGSSRSPAT